MKPEIQTAFTPNDDADDAEDATGASEETDAIDALFAPRATPNPEAGAHYRVAGDSEARAAELEQEVAQLKAQLHDAEHAVYAARRQLEKRSPLSTAAMGGLGSMVGSLIGVALNTGYDNPDLIAAGSVVGFLVGLVASVRWDPPDDNFPKAPPERLR